MTITHGLQGYAHRDGIQAIIDRVMEWEIRSGATLEGDKTVIIHFTRRLDRVSSRPFIIQGEAIALKATAKILGVIMDSELRYAQYIGKGTTKGLLVFTLPLQRIAHAYQNTPTDKMEVIRPYVIAQ